MTVRRSGRGVDSLVVALKALDGLEARTGWFETAKYVDGTSVAMIAEGNEFGRVINSGAAANAYQTGDTGGKKMIFIPPRPFMRPTVAEKRKPWMDQLEKGARAVLNGKATAPQVLEALALTAAGDVATTISRVNSPPLAASTIARKGFAKPLVHTKQMIQSVTGVLVKKGAK